MPSFFPPKSVYQATQHMCARVPLCGGCECVCIWCVPVCVCVLACMCVRVLQAIAQNATVWTTQYMIHSSVILKAAAAAKLIRLWLDSIYWKQKLKFSRFLFFLISANFNCSIVQYILMPVAQSWSKMRLWMAETDCCTAEKIFPNPARTTTTSDHKTWTT